MIKPSPFRLVVRTSSFHVEETGSIPVRDNLLGEASEGSLASSNEGWARGPRDRPVVPMMSEGWFLVVQDVNIPRS